MSTFTWTGGYSPITVTTSSVPYPPKRDTVEFGKAFQVSRMIIATDDGAVKLAYGMALDDYFQSKKENFPNWEGLPEIKVQWPTDSLMRFFNIGWYAEVPISYVVSPDDKVEEDLWNS